MTDAPDPKTIDFAKVFSGQEYPKDSVSVIVNEKLGYEVHRIQGRISDAAVHDDPEARKALEGEYEALAKRAADYTYVFHLTAVSRELRDAVTRGVRDEFGVETDVFGRATVSEEADKAFRSRRWALHVERITGPGGVEAVAPTAENLAAFQSSAPDKAIELVENKIAELSGQGANEGFDLLARDADFLS